MLEFQTNYFGLLKAPQSLKCKCKISDLFTFNYLKAYSILVQFLPEKKLGNLIWFDFAQKKIPRPSLRTLLFCIWNEQQQKSKQTRKKEDKGKVINPKYYKHSKGSTQNRNLDQ